MAPEARAGEAGPVMVGRLDLDRFAILLDVDGTLIEIAATPQEVRVPPALKHVLANLRDRLAGALCLVSGRPLSDLDRLFEPLRVACIGVHGAESRLSIDGPVVHTRTAPMARDLKRRLIGIADDTPGIIAEDKGFSLALHYRLVPHSETSVRQRIAHICADFPEETVEVLPGKSVFEIKPRAFNKGVAVQTLMQQSPFRGRRPVFIGDDVTDESAFAVLPAFDGLGLSVGRELAGTQGYFGTPREVRHWLYELLQGRSGPLQTAPSRGRGVL